MKKFSLIMCTLFCLSVIWSTSLHSQDVNADKSSDVKATTTDTSTKSDVETNSTEHLLKEDTATEHAEKVYEKQEIQILKGKPKTFTDGYNTYVNDKVRFELFDVDNIMPDSKFYKIDAAEEQKYASPFTLSEEGPHVIYYYSVDKMGNKEMQRSLNVIVDKTAPEVTLVVTAPFSKTGDTIYASDKFSYNYSISAKDNISGVAGITYAVAGEEHKAYVKPFTINSLEPVKIDIAAEDKVGNLTKKYKTKILDENGNLLAESMDDIKITVDKTAPVVEIKADKEFFKKDNLLVASKDFKYSITAQDSESGVKSIYYRIDNKSDYILYTGEIIFNTNGMHKIEAIAKDAVGNISSTAILEVYVDVIPADTNIKMVTE
ncbi:MAG: hypothetical protein BWY23_00320 [Spirochaetes bacterium ADurb.Bin218]|nr:MAG: hypothetical protein BWY23_00320 [Spirochaetes bacterium ADurb.Bin218]HOQ11676.1 hypothetical protein [Spirochaetota bacterium]HOV09639.1 hypothetical protein [Spirochaetota bacterium]HPD78091.1 hypothetical protein [Spirochaetota bacterium]HPX91076.1 hypothetical protein [Spirochaetota bacterium]